MSAMQHRGSLGVNETVYMERLLQFTIVGMHPRLHNNNEINGLGCTTKRSPKYPASI
jgi:hypothetical protein